MSSSYTLDLNEETGTLTFKLKGWKEGWVKTFTDNAMVLVDVSSGRIVSVEVLLNPRTLKEILNNLNFSSGI